MHLYRRAAWRGPGDDVPVNVTEFNACVANDNDTCLLPTTGAWR